MSGDKNKSLSSSSTFEPTVVDTPQSTTVHTEGDASVNVELNTTSINLTTTTNTTTNAIPITSNINASTSTNTTSIPLQKDLSGSTSSPLMTTVSLGSRTPFSVGPISSKANLIPASPSLRPFSNTSIDTLDVLHPVLNSNLDINTVQTNSNLTSTSTPAVINISTSTSATTSVPAPTTTSLINSSSLPDGRCEPTDISATHPDINPYVNLSLAEYVREMGGSNVISRVLIANNGIAAVKAIRSIKRWSYETFGRDEIVFVAMATPEDLRANAEYIHLADEFVEVPGGSNNNNYANIHLIRQIGEDKECDAVWAGWGHASENPKLPELLAQSSRKIIWIGPTPGAMRALGDKVGSTLIAQSANVPCMGWSGSDVRIDYATEGIPNDKYQSACITTAEEALLCAEKIGYPVMVKASEGGGGKGIRRVDRKEDMLLSFAQVQSEVSGSPIFVMQLAGKCRHLEVQLLCDTLGNAIAVFGRDCSIQRRHQKIIEEGPVVAAPPHIWRQMEKSAVALAKAVGYVGAGTVEYLYMDDGSYYFLELNPRLQVEHPVTELISGVNLPAAQLQIAMGIPLYRMPGIRRMYDRTPSSQSTIDFDNEIARVLPGHVIACRITAENPDEKFQPTSGLIQEVNFRSTPDVWGYFSVGPNGSVHEFADSQFGHLFALGATREIARMNIALALKELEIRGEIRTTVEYLRAIVEADDFKRNLISTTWLEKMMKEQILTMEKPCDDLAVLCGAIYKAHTSFQGFDSVYNDALNNGHLPTSVLHQQLVTFSNELIYKDVKYPITVHRSGPSSYDVTVDVTTAAGVSPTKLSTRVLEGVEKVDKEKVGNEDSKEKAKNIEDEDEEKQANTSSSTTTATTTTTTATLPTSTSTSATVTCVSSLAPNANFPSTLFLGTINVHNMSDGGYLLNIDGRKHVIYGRETPSGLRLIVDTQTCIFQKEYDPTRLNTEVQGKLIQWLIHDREHVIKGQPIAEVEVMKMIVTLTAQEPGHVIPVKQPGSVLESGDLLANVILDEPEKVRRAAPFNGLFQEPISLPSIIQVYNDIVYTQCDTSGLVNISTHDIANISVPTTSTTAIIPNTNSKKPSAILRDVISKLQYALEGYSLSNTVLERSLSDFFTCLKNPLLPVFETREIISTLSSRLPAELYDQIVTILNNYETSCIEYQNAYDSSRAIFETKVRGKATSTPAAASVVAVPTPSSTPVSVPVSVPVVPVTIPVIPQISSNFSDYTTEPISNSANSTTIPVTTTSVNSNSISSNGIATSKLITPLKIQDDFISTKQLQQQHQRHAQTQTQTQTHHDQFQNLITPAGGGSLMQNTMTPNSSSLRQYLLSHDINEPYFPVVELINLFKPYENVATSSNIVVTRSYLDSGLQALFLRYVPTTETQDGRVLSASNTISSLISTFLQVEEEFQRIPGTNESSKVLSLRQIYKNEPTKVALMAKSHQHVKQRAILIENILDFTTEKFPRILRIVNLRSLLSRITMLEHKDCLNIALKARKVLTMLALPQFAKRILAVDAFLKDVSTSTIGLEDHEEKEKQEKLQQQKQQDDEKNNLSLQLQPPPPTPLNKSLAVNTSSTAVSLQNVYSPTTSFTKLLSLHNPTAISLIQSIIHNSNSIPSDDLVLLFLSHPDPVYRVTAVNTYIRRSFTSFGIDNLTIEPASLSVITSDMFHTLFTHSPFSALAQGMYGLSDSSTHANSTGITTRSWGLQKLQDILSPVSDSPASATSSPLSSIHKNIDDYTSPTSSNYQAHNGDAGSKDTKTDITTDVKNSKDGEEDVIDITTTSQSNPKQHTIVTRYPNGTLHSGALLCAKWVFFNDQQARYEDAQLRTVPVSITKTKNPTRLTPSVLVEARKHGLTAVTPNAAATPVNTAATTTPVTSLTTSTTTDSSRTVKYNKDNKEKDNDSDSDNDDDYDGEENTSLSTVLSSKYVKYFHQELAKDPSMSTITTNLGGKKILTKGDALKYGLTSSTASSVATKPHTMKSIQSTNTNTTTNNDVTTALAPTITAPGNPLSRSRLTRIDSLTSDLSKYTGVNNGSTLNTTSMDMNSDDDFNSMADSSARPSCIEEIDELGNEQDEEDVDGENEGDNDNDDNNSNSDKSKNVKKTVLTQSHSVGDLYSPQESNLSMYDFPSPSNSANSGDSGDSADTTGTTTPAEFANDTTDGDIDVDGNDTPIPPPAQLQRLGVFAHYLNFSHLENEIGNLLFEFTSAPTPDFDVPLNILYIYVTYAPFEDDDTTSTALRELLLKNSTGLYEGNIRRVTVIFGPTNIQTLKDEKGPLGKATLANQRYEQQNQNDLSAYYTFRISKSRKCIYKKHMQMQAQMQMSRGINEAGRVNSIDVLDLESQASSPLASPSNQNTIPNTTTMTAVTAIKPRIRVSEHTKIRHLDPNNAIQMQLYLLDNYETELIPTTNRTIHLFAAIPKDVMQAQSNTPSNTPPPARAVYDGRRFFVRALVRQLDQREQTGVFSAGPTPVTSPVVGTNTTTTTTAGPATLSPVTSLSPQNITKATSENPAEGEKSPETEIAFVEALTALEIAMASITSANSSDNKSSATTIGTNARGVTTSNNNNNNSNSTTTTITTDKRKKSLLHNSNGKIPWMYNHILINVLIDGGVSIEHVNSRFVESTIRMLSHRYARKIEKLHVTHVEFLLNIRLYTSEGYALSTPCRFICTNETGQILNIKSYYEKYNPILDKVELIPLHPFDKTLEARLPPCVPLLSSIYQELNISKVKDVKEQKDVKDDTVTTNTDTTHVYHDADAPYPTKFLYQKQRLNAIANETTWCYDFLSLIERATVRRWRHQFLLLLESLTEDCLFGQSSSTSQPLPISSIEIVIAKVREFLAELSLTAESVTASQKSHIDADTTVTRSNDGDDEDDEDDTEATIAGTEETTTTTATATTTSTTHTPVENNLDDNVHRNQNNYQTYRNDPYRLRFYQQVRNLIRMLRRAPLHTFSRISEAFSMPNSRVLFPLLSEYSRAIIYEYTNLVAHLPDRFMDVTELVLGKNPKYVKSTPQGSRNGEPEHILEEVKREPGLNNIAMVAWKLRLYSPENVILPRNPFVNCPNTFNTSVLLSSLQSDQLGDKGSNINANNNNNNNNIPLDLQKELEKAEKMNKRPERSNRLKEGASQVIDAIATGISSLTGLNLHGQESDKKSTTATLNAIAAMAAAANTNNNITNQSPITYTCPGRDLIVISNDITRDVGSFGPKEDALFELASKYARQHGLPRWYFSANSGARIGLVNALKNVYNVAFVHDESSSNTDSIKSFEYIYLTEEAYKKVGNLVKCYKIYAHKITNKAIDVENEGEAVTATPNNNYEVRYIITDIIGDDTPIGAENLRASGTIAGETSKAYKDIYTATFVTGRSVGIGAYLARLGQRIIQKSDPAQPLLLTGYAALNKLLGRPVYVSNLQLGGPDVMYPNGVTHILAQSDIDGIIKLVQWLSFVPPKQAIAPIISKLGDGDHNALTLTSNLAPTPNSNLTSQDSDVNSRRKFLLHSLLGQTISPIRKINTFTPTKNALYDPRELISTIFDRSSFFEVLGGWARGVVSGRARLGGIPVGVIAVDPRTIETIIPADPAAGIDTREGIQIRPGGVWFPESSYKTATALFDMKNEDIPVIIFANWRGFSGGMQDMYNEILKFGSYIVDALREISQPVIVYLPPHSTLRGGAWVVVDETINPENAEMFADTTARGGILEAEGIIEIKYRINDLKLEMHRLDPKLVQYNIDLKNLQKQILTQKQKEKENSGVVAAAAAAVITEDNSVPAIKIENNENDESLQTLNEKVDKVKKMMQQREQQLLPIYTQIATHFADLHDTPGRLLATGCIREIVDWESARERFYYRIMGRLIENAFIEPLVNARMETKKQQIIASHTLTSLHNPNYTIPNLNAITANIDRFQIVSQAKCDFQTIIKHIQDSHKNGTTTTTTTTSDNFIVAKLNEKTITTPHFSTGVEDDKQFVSIFGATLYSDNDITRDVLANIQKLCSQSKLESVSALISGFTQEQKDYLKFMLQ